MGKKLVFTDRMNTGELSVDVREHKANVQVHVPEGAEFVQKEGKSGWFGWEVTECGDPVTELVWTDKAADELVNKRKIAEFVDE